MGNGTTIKQTPLLNMLEMCGYLSPSGMPIFDSTEHMSAGGKKDKTFIKDKFKGKVTEVDEMTKLTDCFFFYCASKVETAATFQRAMCFHGSKHVLSLFFSDLSKLKPIQVSKV